MNVLIENTLKHNLFEEDYNKNSIETLPIEILLNIFSYTDEKSQISTALVSHFFYHLTVESVKNKQFFFLNILSEFLEKNLNASIKQEVSLVLKKQKIKLLEFQNRKQIYQLVKKTEKKLAKVLKNLPKKVLTALKQTAKASPDLKKIHIIFNLANTYKLEDLGKTLSGIEKDIALEHTVNKLLELNENKHAIRVAKSIKQITSQSFALLQVTKMFCKKGKRKKAEEIALFILDETIREFAFMYISEAFFQNSGVIIVHHFFNQLKRN